LILRAEGIEKRFDGRPVLRGASVEVAPGSVALLQGANGSGKTTLLHVLATLLSPDRGVVTLDGQSVAGGDARVAARRRIGFASHRPLLYLALTPLENLRFFATLARHAEPSRAAASAIERFGMTAQANAPMERFSRGMLQRVVLARAFLGEPSILLLDEPYAGLDDEGVAAMNGALRAARDRGAACLVVTHDAGHVGGLAARRFRIESGRVEVAA
jgi:heme exporter protein A